MSVSPKAEDDGSAWLALRAGTQRVTDWGSVLAATAAMHRSYARTAAIAVIAIQAIFVVFAVITRVMLHADGAYFVFALGTGEPWDLKWFSLPTRIVTYLLTVMPTEFIAESWALSGSQIASVNGLFFYGFQLVQFMIVVKLAWRRFSNLLIFPVAQYAFSTALGFGFPSEILVAPGFFWICMFCLLRRRVPLVLFAVSFAGLVFSHELALLGALLVVVASLQRSSEGRLKHAAAVSICGVVLLAWFILRLNGPFGADSFAIYVFDPRRFLNNPTLWLIAAAGSLIVWRALSAKASLSSGGHFWIAVVLFALPWALHPWIDFAQGRYETGRTLIGIALPLFGAGLILASSRRLDQKPFTFFQRKLTWAAAPMITAALAINVGASSVFLFDWQGSVVAFEKYVGDGQLSTPMKPVTFSEASAALGPSAVEAISRTGFSWTWPYRSVVLAKDYRPQRIIYDPQETVCERGLMSANSGRVPVETRQELTKLLCAPRPSRPPTISQRFVQYLRSFWGDAAK